MRRLGAVVPAGLAALLTACSSPPAATTAPAESVAPPSAGASLAATGPAIRVWEITGHRMPGVSAMGDADADAWHGRVLRLEVQQAANGVDTCEAPAYAAATHPAEAFLAVGYRILPAGLGAPAEATVRVLDVTCHGQPWAALGGRVLSFGAAGEFAVWDGVFFSLRPVAP